MLTDQPFLETAAWRPWPAFALLLSYLSYFGLMIGMQGVLWADVIAALGLSKSVFGTVQLASPLVSVALLMSGARLSHWFGKKPLAVVALAALALANAGLAAAGGLLALVGALLLAGVGNALLEMAANSATLDWERATGRSVMNLMHAGFSAGAVVGALVAGLLVGQGWRYPSVLLLLAALGLLLLLVSLAMRFPPIEAGEQADVGPLATLRLVLGAPAILVLAIICVLGVAGESIANLWSVLYLYGLGASAVVGGAVFALFNVTMFLGRIGNSWLVARAGARSSLVASGVGLALSGVLLLLPGVAAAMLAFALMGLSVAGVVPTVLSAAARLAPGRSAAVTGGIMAMAYVGFIVCPPLTGLVADLASLQVALLLVGLVGLATVALARTVE